MTDCEHRDDYGSTIVSTGSVCILCGKEVADPPAIDPERLALAMDEAFTIEDQRRFVDDVTFWQDYAPRVAAAYREQHG